MTAFRTDLAVRLSRARDVAARRAHAPKPAGTWPTQGLGAVPDAGKDLIHPRCGLGPRELCATLTELITDCDAGDALDCIAVGEYLDDTPPRPLIGIVFFAQACRIGDAAGCERVEELRSVAPVPCEDDPVACAWRALRTNDRELHDQACSLGVADSCSYMILFTQDDPELTRAYLETACQLGWAGACADLAYNLQPDCVSTEDRPCLPADPAAARDAKEIACTAGWGDEAVCTQ